MEQLKFTQAVKDNWIQKLESGEYKQGFAGLVVDDKGTDILNRWEIVPDMQLFYCCIGVLGECTEGLDNFNRIGTTCPYNFLYSTIGEETTEELYSLNDRHMTRPIARDYSNVIKFIKTLPVQED